MLVFLQQLTRFFLVCKKHSIHFFFYFQYFIGLKSLINLKAFVEIKLWLGDQEGKLRKQLNLKKKKMSRSLKDDEIVVKHTVGNDIKPTCK